MKQVNYEKWAEIARKAQEPFKAMAELNLKTLQDISFLKPEELASIKKPEELLEKQVKVMIENGHKALDHMQKSFQIFEAAILSLVQEKSVFDDITKAAKADLKKAMH